MQTNATRPCRCCTYGLNYEVGDDAKCIRCLDTKVEPITCDGCDGHVDGGVIAKYLVTHHDGGSSEAWYCRDCAELARMDWNGETAAIEAL